MGTEEKDSEHEPEHLPKQIEPTGKDMELLAEHPLDPPSESSDPLNTYKWHTGSKGTLDGVKGEVEGGNTSATSTIEKAEKSSTGKWNKMQNWRKALSEDPGDKSSSMGKSGDASKPEKGAGARKNPFRRALSEPPGSLFAALSSSSNSANSAQASPSTATAEASGISPMDTPQKGGGGAIFRRYLKTMSQKLKRPRLQSRNSTPTLLPGEVPDSIKSHSVHSHRL